MVSGCTATPTTKISRRQIADWWDTLSHHQQGTRKSELRRFFNWIQDEGGCLQLEYNPFTTNDDRPRLYQKAKPQKARSPMDLPTFWSIYHVAGDRGYHGLQIAMILSLVTTLREGDILNMRFSQVENDTLRVVVGKSEKQRGAASATRLEWYLGEYPILREAINRARESSLSHHRCPFIIHYKGQRVTPSKYKKHRYQMLKRQLSDQFAKCRPDQPNPTTFHGIRALSSVILRKKGYQLHSIQELLAHSDEVTTRRYQDYGDLPFVKVTLYLTEKDIEGEI